jgi:hypothetical protein
MNLHIRHLAIAAATACSIALTGCTLESNSAPATPTTSSLGTIHGKAFGGNQPISGASVYVYAAGTAAYGGASALLSTTVPTTGLDGSFTITGDYTCLAGQQVYVYVLGGNTGSGANANSGLMAVLGQCPAGGGDLSSVTPFVWVNEVTTVATAYAISGFATDATHVSDDETATGNTTAAIAKVGMANAFANAAALANVATGTALITTGNSSASGQTNPIVVPQAQINTIADVLAACVNTTGGTANDGTTTCGTLFGVATSTGISTGTAPTETATAAINIAHHPTANVAALYGVIASQGAAFIPDDGSAPPDFTITILYPQGGSATTGIAVDGNGNVYGAYGGGNLVYAITPVGVETTLLVQAPRRLAIDAKNNVWVPTTGASGGTGAGTISMFAPGAAAGSTGTLFNAYTTAGTQQYSVGAVAFDQNDNLWELSSGTVAAKGLTVNELPYVTTPSATAAGVTIVTATAPSMIAFSPTTGNLAVTSGATTTGILSIYTDAAGTVVGTVPTAGSAGLYTPTGVISDATGNFWIGNGASTNSSTNTTISVFNGTTDASVTGAPYSITPPTGETTTQLISGEFDGAGNYFTGGTTYATGTTATNLPAIYQFSGTGTQLAVFVPSTPAVTGGSDASNQFVGVDPSGNLWFGATKYIGEMIGVAAPKVTPTVAANFPGLIQTTPVTGLNPTTYPNKVATRP